MTDKIRACEWGLNVFRNGIPAHRSRPILWELHGSASHGVKRGSNNIYSDDGDSLYRIRISIWVDEFMRKCGNNELIISNPVCGGRHSGLSMRRI